MWLIERKKRRFHRHARTALATTGVGTIMLASRTLGEVAGDKIGDWFGVSGGVEDVRGYSGGGYTEESPVVFPIDSEVENEEVSQHTIPKEYLDERFGAPEKAMPVTDSDLIKTNVLDGDNLTPVEPEAPITAQENLVQNIQETVYLDNGTETSDGNELRLDLGGGGDGIDNRTSPGERTFSYSVERMNLGESFVKTLPQEVQDALKSTGKSLEEVAHLYIVPEDGVNQAIEIPKNGNVISITPNQLGYELFSEENGKMEFHGARAHFGFMVDGKLYSIATDMGNGMNMEDLSEDIKNQAEISSEVSGETLSTSPSPEEVVQSPSPEEMVISTSQPIPETITAENFFSLPESYEVQKGDSLTKIAGNIVESAGIEMTSDQKEVFYASVNEYLRGLSSEEVKEMGISSGDINDIYYDRDILNLSEIFSQESLVNALENAGVNTSSLEGVESLVEPSSSEMPTQEISSPEKVVESSLDDGGVETQTPSEVDPKIAEYSLGESSLKSLGADHMQNMTEVIRVNAQDFQYPSAFESPEQYMQERMEGLMEDKAQESGTLDSQAKIGSLLSEFENARLGEAIVRPSATTGYPELYFPDSQQLLSEEIEDFVRSSEEVVGESTNEPPESTQVSPSESESPETAVDSEYRTPSVESEPKISSIEPESPEVPIDSQSPIPSVDSESVISSVEPESPEKAMDGPEESFQDTAEPSEEISETLPQEDTSESVLEREEISLEEIQGQTLRELVSEEGRNVSLENIQAIESKLNIPEHLRYSSALERLSIEDGIIDMGNMTQSGVLDSLQVSRGEAFTLKGPNGESIEEVMIANLEPKDWKNSTFVTQQVEQLIVMITSGPGDPQEKLDRFVEVTTERLESKGLGEKGLEFIRNEGNSSDKLRKLIASEFIYNRLQITH